MSRLFRDLYHVQQFLQEPNFFLAYTLPILLGFVCVKEDRNFINNFIADLGVFYYFLFFSPLNRIIVLSSPLMDFGVKRYVCLPLLNYLMGFISCLKNCVYIFSFSFPLSPI